MVALHNSHHTNPGNGSLSLVQLFFNPSAALILTLFGYYTFASYFERFLPDSSLGAVLVLGFIAFYSTATFILNWRQLVPKHKKRTIFIYIFLSLYGLRLLTEVFIDGTVYPTGNETVLLYFFVNTVILVPVISSMSWKFNDRNVANILMMFCIIFLIGMSFNFSALSETAAGRLSLTKVNPIVMAHLSLSYMIFCFVFFRRNSGMKLFSFIVLPILFFIFAYARSRGAYVALMLVAAFYIVAQKGQRRIFVMIGAGFAGLIALTLISQDVQDVIISRLLLTTSGDDQSANIRLLLLKNSTALFWEHPFFGKTILDPVLNFYPHNFIIESLISTGILGTFFLMAHISISLWACLSIIRSNLFPKFVEFLVLVYIQQLFAFLVSGAIWGASALMTISCVILYIYYGRSRPMRTSMS